MVCYLSILQASKVLSLLSLQQLYWGIYALRNVIQSYQKQINTVNAIFISSI